MLPAVAVLAEVATLGASLLFGPDKVDPNDQLAQWLEFLERMSNGNPRAITSEGRLGAYEISVRRLCDLELMENPVKLSAGWSGEWVAPYSLEGFLSDPVLQLETFRRSMRDYAKAVSPWVGRNVDDVVTTRSGLLAVAHRAGLRGLKKWLVSEDERATFSNTTETFFAANGIF